jgi:hypothetical protein
MVSIQIIRIKFASLSTIPIPAFPLKGKEKCSAEGEQTRSAGGKGEFTALEEGE